MPSLKSTITIYLKELGSRWHVIPIIPILVTYLLAKMKHWQKNFFPVTGTPTRRRRIKTQTIAKLFVLHVNAKKTRKANAKIFVLYAIAIKA